MTTCNNSYFFYDDFIHDPVIACSYPVGIIVAFQLLDSVRIRICRQFEDGERRTASIVFRQVAQILENALTNLQLPPGQGGPPKRRYQSAAQISVPRSGADPLTPPAFRSGYGTPQWVAPQRFYVRQHQ